MKSTPIQEIAFIELEDTALLELLGFLHESVKDTEEKMKADEELLRMEEDIKEYKKEHYTDDLKIFKGKLKAVRAHAKARGLRFEPLERAK